MSDTRPGRDLQPLFRPSSVAIIGASDRNPWSRMVARTLDTIGFSGPLHLVNPRNAIVLDRPAVPLCVAIGAPVDAAFIAVPTEAIGAALSDMAAAGIRYGAIVSSGFAEAGEEGRRLQQALVDQANELGLTILGPNSLGFVNFRDRVALSAIPLGREPRGGGQLGIVSQSGATASMLLRFAENQGIALSYAVALGNEAMVDLASVIEFFIDDDATKSIAVFAESIRDAPAFIAAAERARHAQKPIVVLKVGRGELAARAAQAHTGSLVGDDRAFSAVCRQYGIVRVDSMEQLVLTGEFLGRIGPVEGKGCAIASISGGACEMIADRGDDEGVPFAEFTVETTARLATILPDFAAPQNPLDVTGVVQADPGMFRDALLAIADDPGVDLIAAIFEAPTSPNAGVTAQVTGVLRSIGEAMQKAPVPGFMLSQILSPISEYGREVLADVGIPVALTGLDHGARAIGALYRWSEALRRPTTVASLRKNDARPRTECEALACLAAAGVSTIPAIVANCAADATDHARALDGPVALKILSPDIAHKTEVGGVRLGVAPEGAAAAYEAIIASVQRHAPDARVEGVIVSPMRGQGIEMLVGVTRDPVWGPMLAVGLGGIWVEALADVSLRLAPVDPAEARRMLEELRGFKLLAGFRGAPPADLVRLADTIATISQVATSFGADLEAFEVNPLFVRGDTIEALDALATWREPESDDCDDGPATPAVQQPVAVDAGGPQ